MTTIKQLPQTQSAFANVNKNMECSFKYQFNTLQPQYNQFPQNAPAFQQQPLYIAQQQPLFLQQQQFPQNAQAIKQQSVYTAQQQPSFQNKRIFQLIPSQQQPLLPQQNQFFSDNFALKQQPLSAQLQEQFHFQQKFSQHLQNNNQNFPLSQQKQQVTILADDDEIEQKQVVVDQNKEDYDLENNLIFEIRSLYKSEKLLSSKAQYLPGMISIKTKEDQLEESRAGVDLVCLIDKSGSMQGAKIEMVKQALNVLLDFLTEKDRLQLITFDNFAQKLTPLKKINDTNKEQIQNVISAINAGGGTEISTATQIAFEQLQNRKQRNNVTSIFIYQMDKMDQPNRVQGHK